MCLHHETDPSRFPPWKQCTVSRCSAAMLGMVRRVTFIIDTMSHWWRCESERLLITSRMLAIGAPTKMIIVRTVTDAVAIHRNKVFRKAIWKCVLSVNCCLLGKLVVWSGFTWSSVGFVALGDWVEGALGNHLYSWLTVQYSKLPHGVWTKYGE
jgi:hypothetical protein